MIGEENNLYRVKCHGMFQSKWVYVVAKTPNDASKKALQEMKDLNWIYDSYTGTIELIALGSHLKGAELLIE